jgi:hypothetical protein
MIFHQGVVFSSDEAVKLTPIIECRGVARKKKNTKAHSRRIRKSSLFRVANSPRNPWVKFSPKALRFA